MRQRLRAPAGQFAPPFIGLVLGLVLVVTSADRAAPQWWLWAPLALASSTAAGVVLVYGARRWTELSALHPLRMREVTTPVAAVVLGGTLGINVPVLLPGTDHADWRGGLLLTLPLIAGSTAGGAMYGVRHVASNLSQSPTAGAQLAMLIDLRRLLRRLLAAVGSLVALSALQAGAAMTLERSVNPAFTRPPQYVLIIGGFGSLLVALAYAPGWTALQRAGQHLCDELFPIQSLDEASKILSTAEARQKLEGLLGTDRSVLTDMQSDLIILAPLLASAAATFLPH